MAESRGNCELCNDEATIYCPSDSAFLCWTCDSKVHTANFLAARHIRLPVCSACRNLDDRRISGAGISPPVSSLCRSCSPEDFSGAGDVDSLSSSSSSCVSSTTEAGEEAVSKRKEKVFGRGERDTCQDLTKVEVVLVNWCRRMGVGERKTMRVVSTAVKLLRGCVDRMTVRPFRVSLASALVVALRLRGDDTCQDLSKVERISGVPAKLILAIESRIARVVKRKQSREDHEEGWAEC